MLNVQETITLLISLYGAVLSTIVYKSSVIKIKIDLLKNMTNLGTQETNNYFKITNCIKEDLYVESICIQLLGEDKNRRNLLLDSNAIQKIGGYTSRLYPSEKGFDLSNLKTVKVYMGHGEYYTKHFASWWERIRNKKYPK